MGEHIQRAIRAKRIPWPTKIPPGRCGECKGPRHAPWWLSTPPPSCCERQVAAGRAAA